mgnify:FL=1|tara:strand:- start:634 stop:1299 length:666 start_codon:yes stop_codon:yes gene_type:complete
MGLINLLQNDPTLFLLIAISLIFALCVHEFSHGVIAYQCGDDTAYRKGRLTLNPINHLDPIGSLMILLIGVGYAKPVPVNPYNLKNPRIDMIKIAAAGPISNFILALLGSLLFVILWKVDMNTDSSKLFFNYFIMINIYLGLFNLIPIHPLDGGQIFGNFISKYNPDIFRQLYQYGPKVLIGIILFGLFTGFSIIGLVIGYPAQLIFGFFMLLMDYLTFFL